MTAPVRGMPHTNRISGLVYQRDQARAEVERLALERDGMRDRTINLLMGRCVTPEIHGGRNISFREFLERGGDQCPLCLKQRLEAAERVVEAVRKTIFCERCHGLAEQALAGRGT